MCSRLINLANSCYTDNFGMIFDVFAKALVMGIILGTVVGVLLLFIKSVKG